MEPDTRKFNLGGNGLFQVSGMSQNSVSKESKMVQALD
jgi:hypothetical protein